MEAKGARQRARKLDVPGSRWDDICEVKLEEVGRADDGFSIDIADESL